jgi:hypothetical protein
MRTDDRALGKHLAAELRRYPARTEALHRIGDNASLNTFVFQVIESVRRIRFIKEIAKRDLSPERANPASELFDPIRAAILEKRAGHFEEACWFVFLFTHFGKSVTSGYRLLRDVYGRLGQGPQWGWAQIRKEPVGFLAAKRSANRALRAAAAKSPSLWTAWHLLSDNIRNALVEKEIIKALRATYADSPFLSSLWNRR